MQNAQNLTTGKKLFILVGSAVGFIILISLVASGVLLFLSMSQGHIIDTQYPNIVALKILQLITTIVTFLVPVLILAKECRIKSLSFVQADKRISAMPLLMVVAAIIVIQPFMNATSEWFSGWSLPSSLSGLEHWLKEMEKRNLDLVRLFLDVSTVGGLAFNIVVVAIAPAICEEFFFRGGLQKLFREKMNQHAAIWLAAIIFSAVHLEVSGFLPRILLGACFGYLLVWTGSIWYPVAAHFINNLGGVVAEYLIYNHIASRDLEKFGTGGTLWATAFGLALFCVMLWFVFRKRSGAKVSVSAD